QGIIRVFGWFSRWSGGAGHIVLLVPRAGFGRIRGDNETSPYTQFLGEPIRTLSARGIVIQPEIDALERLQQPKKFYRQATSPPGKGHRRHACGLPTCHRIELSFSDDNFLGVRWNGVPAEEAPHASRR